MFLTVHITTMAWLQLLGMVVAQNTKPQGILQDSLHLLLLAARVTAEVGAGDVIRVLRLFWMSKSLSAHVARSLLGWGLNSWKWALG
jgi:hypothetical protein